MDGQGKKRVLKSHSSKLMRLGPTNRIVDDSDSKAVDFDRRFRSDLISTTIIESTIIESTIAISILN